MAQILRQSTAIDVRLGPFVDVGDGFTPETGITIAAADEAEILKANGAATVAMAGTLAAVTGCDGWYDYTLSTTDTDTVGTLDIVMQDDSVCLPVFARFQVVEEEVFDDIFKAAAVGYLKPTTAGRDLDVSAGGEAGIDWANVGSPTTAVDLSGTDIQLVDTCTTNTDMVGTNSAALASVCTEARLSELDAGTAGKAANQIDVIEADTTSLNDTKIPDTISLANINAEVDTALNTAIPGSPTANSINQRVAAVDDLTQASGAGDLAAILTDTGTTLDGALATVDANVDAILADTGTDGVVVATGAITSTTFGTGAITAGVMAAAALEADVFPAGIIVSGAASGTPTTTTMPTDLTEATNDHYNGRIVVWTSGVLAGQATDITDYDGATKTLTFTAVTEAATAADTFHIY